ncbi:FtsK/SpoIIIE domain-containing protein [Herbiconiux sp. 11R-BC]|uniref:FtsK/SpoIIIE domain-containing protein n=1 Tax=Herbiconiux sp. 11R-BC TaxID=3111637 RepID=UPI003C004DC4
MDLRGELRWLSLEVRDAWRSFKVVIVVFVVFELLFNQFAFARVALLGVAAATIAVILWRRFGRGLTLVEHARLRWQRETARAALAVWPELMLRLGLSVRGASGLVEVPSVSSYGWNGASLVMTAALPLGMERRSLALAAPALAESLSALAVSVSAAPGGADLSIEYLDPLATPFSTAWPDSADLRAIPMGVESSGRPWTVRLGPHTLVAGSSGSGKASMIWGLLIGLAPAIRSNLVQAYGIDLKGGMELTMGRKLLTSYATDPAQAVQLLEDLVSQMKKRAGELAGKSRQHIATPGSPHILVVIDELAALTAYLSDRQLQQRANVAIALLCSQGRAPGFTVFACLQDPRRETLPSRGLFTQTIGLRLRDAMETSMVLGEGMREKGALCHQIPSTLPGVAYVVPEDGGDPIRVRAGHATDELITQVADAFEAPQHIEITVPQSDAPDEAATSARPRRSRRTQKTGEEK